VGRLREMDADELSSLERSRLAALTRRIRSDQEALGSLVRPQFVHLVQRMAELQHAS
jgi:hypothetical protein